MNIPRSLRHLTALTVIRNARFSVHRCMRITLPLALGATLALAPHAQQQQRAAGKETNGPNVVGVASSKQGEDTVVTISADGPLSRAQTWREPGKFNIVLPYGKTVLPNGAGRGVKMERVGDSLLITVPTRSGADVTVQPRDNRLDLIVRGGADETLAVGEASQLPSSEVPAPPAEASATVGVRGGRRGRRDEKARSAAPPEASNDEPATVGNQRRVPAGPAADAAGPGKLEQTTQPARTLDGPSLVGTSPGHNPSPAQAQDSAAAATTGDAQPSAVAGASGARKEAVSWEFAAAEGAAPHAGQGEQSSSGFLSFLGLLLGVGAFALAGVVLLWRRTRRGGEVEAEAGAPVARDRRLAEPSAAVAGQAAAGEARQFEQHKGERRRGDRRKGDRRRGGEGADALATRESGEEGSSNGAGARKRKKEARSNPLAPAVVFGSYRVGQEITKLVRGEAHAVEVLSSRAGDDRRAIETALLKALDSPESGDDGQRRARTALEDYGFVARQCAGLLLSDDTYERVAAAQTLGKMQSASSLPFLLEALYDGDTAVRSEAVVGLGALGLPSAIGALLDIARRHPDLPVSLLGPALTSCSVEPLNAYRGGDDEGFHAGADFGEAFTGEITGLEPVSSAERLPEWLEDESLGVAFERLESTDVEVRISAAQSLALFRVRRAVEALSALAWGDQSPAVRAAAVTGLSLIDHESVFAPVLVAMGDEAREVRAAAARSLSRLSFERADAYVLLIEEADGETLRLVAQACLKAGLTAQAVDRLASEDRRQAYEAFTLLSLAVRAGYTQPVFDAVENHADINVRLAAVRMLGLICQPELLAQLRELAGRGGVPEKVRAAILEAVHRADLPLPLAV